MTSQVNIVQDDGSYVNGESERNSQIEGKLKILNLKRVDEFTNFF